MPPASRTAGIIGGFGLAGVGAGAGITLIHFLGLSSLSGITFAGLSASVATVAAGPIIGAGLAGAFLAHIAFVNLHDTFRKKGKDAYADLARAVERPPIATRKLFYRLSERIHLQQVNPKGNGWINEELWDQGKEEKKSKRKSNNLLVRLWQGGVKWAKTNDREFQELKEEAEAGQAKAKRIGGLSAAEREKHLDEVRKAHLKAVEEREGAADIERNLFGFVQERCLELTAAQQRYETSLIRKLEATIELSFAKDARRAAYKIEEAEIALNDAESAREYREKDVRALENEILGVKEKKNSKGEIETPAVPGLQTELVKAIENLRKARHAEMYAFHKLRSATIHANNQWKGLSRFQRRRMRRDGQLNMDLKAAYTSGLADRAHTAKQLKESDSALKIVIRDVAGVLKEFKASRRELIPAQKRVAKEAKKLQELNDLGNRVKSQAIEHQRQKCARALQELDQAVERNENASERISAVRAELWETRDTYSKNFQLDQISRSQQRAIDQGIRKAERLGLGLGAFGLEHIGDFGSKGRRMIASNFFACIEVARSHLSSARDAQQQNLPSFAQRTTELRLGREIAHAKNRVAHVQAKLEEISDRKERLEAEQVEGTEKELRMATYRLEVLQGLLDQRSAEVQRLEQARPQAGDTSQNEVEKSSPAAERANALQENETWPAQKAGIKL
jgi:hypothetical protein